MGKLVSGFDWTYDTYIILNDEAHLQPFHNKKQNWTAIPTAIQLRAKLVQVSIDEILCSVQLSR